MVAICMHFPVPKLHRKLPHLCILDTAFRTADRATVMVYAKYSTTAGVLQPEPI